MQIKSLSIGISLLAVGLLCSCGQQQYSEQNASSSSNATSKEMEKAEMAPLQDAQRKMMKQADMRMRVQDVQKTTVQLERTATQLGGVVMNSQMTNQVQATEMLPYSNDSLKQANIYTSNAYLQVRIPVRYLDTFLSTSAQVAVYIDERNINLEDATLQYLSNEWKNKATTSDVYKRAGQKATDAGEVIAVGAAQNDDTELKVDRSIQNLAINDNVKYTTIRIDLYQPEMIDYQILANTGKQTQAGFWSQIISGIDFGVQMIRNIMVFLVHIWPLWIVAAVAILIIFRKRRFNSKRLLPVT